jgi:hypothetical protein
MTLEIQYQDKPQTVGDLQAAQLAPLIPYEGEIWPIVESNMVRRESCPDVECWQDLL